MRATDLSRRLAKLAYLSISLIRPPIMPNFPIPNGGMDVLYIDESASKMNRSGFAGGSNS
jgi:hypothetical protein